MITKQRLETQADLARLLRAKEVDRLVVGRDGDAWIARATRHGVTVRGEATSRLRAIGLALQLVAEGVSHG